MLTINRRSFLKFSAIGLAGITARPWISHRAPTPGTELARVATKAVSVYAEPWDKSVIVAQRYRDEIIPVYYDQISEHGPGYNPLWHRVWQGYVHSAHIQKVKVVENVVLDSVPEKGILAEITVPYVQSYRLTKTYGWQPIYRLYFGSLHWIIGIEEGPDGEPWYRIKDELLSARHENYHAPASAMRPIPPEEYSPISTHVSPEHKRIEVDLSTQTLYAFENNSQVLKTTISSGIPRINVSKKGDDSDTPKGKFNTIIKHPSKHMGEGYFTDDVEAYILPGVPWVSFFTKNGVGFHGVYWHNNFGMTMSHGCVNMRTDEAKWIFRWTTPTVQPDTMETNGFGTFVEVF